MDLKTLIDNYRTRRSGVKPLTVAAFAARVGISLPYLNALRAGTKEPRQWVAQAIARVTGLSQRQVRNAIAVTRRGAELL